ncbi:MAG: hypothetical protein ACKOF9_07355 [Burkholderiales bacterium]
MNPVERVIQLAKEAEEKRSVSFDATDVLPFSTAALKQIADHPELQAEFEQVFCEMPGYAPTEFVQVCMHALRWEKVKSRIRAQVSRGSRTQ